LKPYSTASRKRLVLGSFAPPTNSEGGLFDWASCVHEGHAVCDFAGAP